MSWLASIDVLEGGIWYTISACRDKRSDAWAWLRGRMNHYTAKGIKFKRTKVTRSHYQRTDPGQYAFLQGNEECAREWQEE